MGDNNTSTQTAPSQSTQQSPALDPQATMAVLAQLIQQQPAMSMVGQNGQPAVGNAQGQQLHPVQQAAQDGAIKAIKEHAYNAVANAGVNAPAVANHIVDNYGGGMGQPPMSMAGGGVNQQGLQALQGLVPPNQSSSIGNANTVAPQNNQAMLPPKNPLTSEGFNPQTGQMQEGGFAERAVRGLVTGGLPGMLAGLLGPSIGTQMEGVKGAQVLKAGQPAEIALPQAQASQARATAKQTQAETAAGKPQADVAFVKQNTTALQQEWQNKAKEIQAGIYKTQNDRNMALKQNILDSRKQILDQMTDDLQHGPILNRGQRLEMYRKSLDFYDGELQDLNGKINQTGNAGYISTGTLPDGTRVGKKSDGTIEKIPMGGATGKF